MQQHIPRVRTRSTGTTKTDFSTGVFWMLLSAGLIVLGACLVTPSWVRSQELVQQRRALGAQVARGRERIGAEHEAIEASRSDVAYNERLLIEELNYGRPGEQVLLAGDTEQAEPKKSVTAEKARIPGWLRGFVESDTRSLLAVMSGGLVVFALVYYPSRRRRAGPSSAGRIPVRPVSANFAEPTEQW